LIESYLIIQKFIRYSKSPVQSHDGTTVTIKLINKFINISLDIYYQDEIYGEIEKIIGTASHQSGFRG